MQPTKNEIDSKCSAKYLFEPVFLDSTGSSSQTRPTGANDSFVSGHNNISPKGSHKRGWQADIAMREPMQEWKRRRNTFELFAICWFSPWHASRLDLCIMYEIVHHVWTCASRLDLCITLDFPDHAWTCASRMDLCITLDFPHHIYSYRLVHQITYKVFQRHPHLAFTYTVTYTPFGTYTVHYVAITHTVMFFSFGIHVRRFREQFFRPTLQMPATKTTIWIWWNKLTRQYLAHVIKRLEDMAKGKMSAWCNVTHWNNKHQNCNFGTNV